MFRPFAALAAGLLLATGAAAADPAKAGVTIRWHGQSFFEIISSKGTRVVTDPHAIENYGRTHVNADLILISHLHPDHSQYGVIENWKEAKILWGLNANKKADWNTFDEKVRDVHVRSVPVYHDDKQGMMRGKNTVFVIEMDGLNIVHLGDLGHLLTKEQIKRIGPVDVLMIPIGGVYTINGADAKEVVTQLKPTKYILPMHYGTKVFDQLLPPDEFLEDQKKENVKRLDGNELVVSKDFKPAEPVIVLMNWEKK
jgi:L-ascorbate metabolism protein UlaG (beta-lactamase superfamily)